MLPAAAIIANVDTVLVMADPNQRIEQDKTYAARNPWSSSGRWGILRNPETIWVTDALGSSTNVHCARLTLCKRCGPQLTAFCNRVFSFLGDFQSHTCAPNTRLKFNFYSGENWWPASSMPHGVWRSSSDEVAWHERLFRCLGATILVQLVDLERSADGQWDCNAMVVLVACYLHRVIGPLSAYLKELVGAARLEGRLRHTVDANVQVCIVDTLTGPTAEVTHIIRHRRVTTATDQHRGLQSDPRRLYVALTRGKISTTVWMEKEPFGMPWRRTERVRRSENATDAEAQTFLYRMFDAIQEFAIPAEDADEAPLPFEEQCAAVLSAADNSWRNVGPPSKVVEEGGWACLDDFLTHTGSIDDLFTESIRGARSRGIDAATNAPLNFGRIRPALATVSAAFMANDIEHAINLGCKLVNGIVTTAVGKTGLQISVPTVDVPQLLQSFSDGTAIDGEPMIRSLLAVVWGLYEAVCEPQNHEELIQVVHAHKTEDREIEGCRWWSRCCNSDREASILEAPAAAHRKKRRCYAYLGGGALSVASSTLLQNIVVKTKTRDMGACVIAACALLSQASQDEHRVRPCHEMFIAAEDVAENDDNLIEILDSDEDEPGMPAATGADRVQYETPGLEFATLCETTLAKAAAHLGLNNNASAAEAAQILRSWAADLAAAAGPAAAPPRPPGVQTAPAPRPWPAASSSSSTWWGSTGWEYDSQRWRTD